MRNMVAVVERSRAVRRASRQFALLWLIDRWFIAPALDRIVHDLAHASASPAQSLTMRNHDDLADDKISSG